MPWRSPTGWTREKKRGIRKERLAMVPGGLPGGAVGVGRGSVLEVLGEETGQDFDSDLGSVLDDPVSRETV